MAGKQRVGKVTAKAFTERAAGLIEEVRGEGGPVVITSGGKPVAALVGFGEYNDMVRRLEGYERMMKNLAKPEKARMEAHAQVMAEISRKGRKV